MRTRVRDLACPIVIACCSLYRSNPRVPRLEIGSSSPGDDIADILPKASSEVEEWKSRPHLLLARSDIIKFRSKRNFYQDYDLKELVGTGSFGSVFLCIHRPTQLRRACKIIKKRSSVDIGSFLNEASICMQLDHPNIIRLIEYYEERHQVRLIFNFCSGEDLFTVIDQTHCRRKHFTSKEVAWAMVHIMKALIGCHSKSIVHRDIKPENFVITDGEKVKAFGLTHAGLRLIDMGVAEYLKSETPDLELSCGGTVRYMAPEVLRGKFDHRSDTWSVGVILYTMLVGVPLFTDPGSVENHILDPNYVARKLKLVTPRNCPWISEEALDLCRKMLAREPSERIGLHDAMNHPFLKKVSEKSSQKQSLGASLFEVLEKFCSYPALKRSAFLIFAHFSGEKYTKIQRRTFRAMDTNHDGQITVVELRNYIIAHSGRPLSRQLENEIFNFVSFESGHISLSKFLAATLPRECFDSPACIEFVFSLFDTDSDGKITWQDLERLMDGRMEPAMLKAVINEVAPDGTVSVDDFTNLILG